MAPIRMLSGTLACLMLLVLAPCVLAQQSGQTGSGAGSTGSTGGSTGNTGNPTRTNPPPAPGSGTSGQRPKNPLPYITGLVVMEDGTATPMGVLIERICGGQSTREAYVKSGGQFSFQIGALNNFMIDASTQSLSGSDTPWNPGQLSPGMASDSEGAMGKLVGCEVRAVLPGYRSSWVILRAGQVTGRMMDVGTLVLCPIEKVSGTTVSATSLLAPKDAKKALERAEKALQKQQFEEAEKGIKNAIEAYPKYAAAYFRLGQLHQQQRRNEDARIAFSKALEMDGNYVNPYIELARIDAQEQKWAEVVAHTDRALALDPLDFPDGFVLNALANFNLKSLAAAESSARKAQRLDSLHRFPQGHLILAGILRYKQDPAGEAEQLRSYLKYAPSASNVGTVRSRLLELERTGDPIADRLPPRP